MSQSRSQSSPTAKAARRCRGCAKKFIPHVRLKERQKFCGAAMCRLVRRKRYQRSWRMRNGDAERGYQDKRGKRPGGFWKQYRRTHPTSTNRNREQAKIRARLARKSLQRNLDILQVAVAPKKIPAFSKFATKHRCSILRAFGSEDTS